MNFGQLTEYYHVSKAKMEIIAKENAKLKEENKMLKDDLAFSEKDHIDDSVNRNKEIAKLKQELEMTKKHINILRENYI